MSAVLDAIQFIAYFRTASVEASLKSIRSKEARKTAVALRLRRRMNSLLYHVVERAYYLELMGVDRKLATEQLVSELRLRIEDSQRRAREIFNFVAYSLAMLILAAIILGVTLSILSPIASQMAAALMAVSLPTLVFVENYLPPVRQWNYLYAALASLPAFFSIAIPQLAYATIPAAVLYAVYYYLPKYKEAVEEFRAASLGRLAVAETPMAKQMAQVMQTVRQSGAFDLQVLAEYMVRLADYYYTSLRRDGLMRALVAASFVIIAGLAVAWIYPQLVAIAKAAQGGPIQLYLQSPRPMMAMIVIVSMFIAARLTESYAALPLYSPLALVLIFT